MLKIIWMTHLIHYIINIALKKNRNKKKIIKTNPHNKIVKANQNYLFKNKFLHKINNQYKALTNKIKHKQIKL